ncbi:MAG TPA: hypothetical protein VGH37_16365 [Candidatus Acidoferrum sp.]|jgi:hypothetical protein
MQRSSAQFLSAAVLLCLLGIVFAAAAQEVDDQLTANKHLFKGIGLGLRSLRRGSDGKYYILATPNVGLAVFDPEGKQLALIGAPPPEPIANKAGRSAIAFAEDCDVDSKGNMYVADRGYNLINEFAPDGKILRSIPVNGPTGVLALPDGEVAVTAFHGTHLITVYNATGRLVREFGDPEDLATRPELNRYLSQGRLASDSQARVYYGYTYLPEPRVRQYDRFGYGGMDFEFTGLGAWSEGRAARREIDRQDKRTEPPSLHPVLTAFGVDPVNGDVWMCLHNTLLHFDKDGNRRSAYQIYTSDNARLEANVLLVEEDRLLIGSDPLGIFEFHRPDRNH